ncbi:hypothetical protein SB766_19820 [Pseudomonas sp. SIMBA_077]
MSYSPKNPADYNLSTWMTDLPPSTNQLKLHHLTLPSTHHAGVDKKGVDGPTEGWIACQNDTFSFQLAGGVRVFDLRIKAKYIGGTLVFRFHHGGRESERNVDDLIKDCNDFFKNGYAKKKNEIVIFNFNDFINFDIGHGERENLQHLLETLWSGFSGANQSAKILPRSASGLTLLQIRTQFPGHNIVIASSKFSGQPTIWDDIPHYWVGIDIPNEQQLDTYIDKNTITTYKSSLWSLQAVRYEKLYGPMHIGPYLNKKFKPYSQAIINSNIINVDFFESSLIVNYCISANLYKGERLVEKQPPSQPEIIEGFFIPALSYVINFRASHDNFTVSHYVYTIDDGEEQIVASEYTAHQMLVLTLMPDIDYEFKLYAVDMAGNRSVPATKTLKMYGEPTGSQKPTSPTILLITRDDKYRCSVSFQPSQWNVDHHVIEVYAYEDIVDGKPVGKPMLSKILSRWAIGAVLDGLPNYDACLMFVYAVNSFDLASDYSIRQVSAYRPISTPPTDPSDLESSYDPISQQLTVTFIEGEAHTGITNHILTVNNDAEQTYEFVSSGKTIPQALSLDYTLALYAKDQDNNCSNTITLQGSTKECNQYRPEAISEQTVLREKLTSGTTTWKGKQNIVQYEIHLYETKDVEGSTGAEDGKIIGEPLRKVFYSGNELTYTFDNLIRLKEYYVFVWGINAYGTVGERTQNSNFTFMHGDPSWDQEYPTVPSNLVICYRYKEGKLYAYWNAASDNIGIDHYIIIVNGEEHKITEAPAWDAFHISVPLDQDINYEVLAYAVDINNNRSRTTQRHGDTSNQDISGTPYKPNLPFIKVENNEITFFYGALRNMEHLNLIFWEEDTEIKKHVRAMGTTNITSVPHTPTGKFYKLEAYGVNSLGEAGEKNQVNFKA